MEHAHNLQQSHGECMQEMEREAIEEEGRDCQSFLTACGVALQAWSPRSTWDTHVPSTIANGEHAFGCSLGHFPQPSTAGGESVPTTPCPTASVAPMPKQ